MYYWFARLRLGYTFSAMLLQPVVVAVFVGLLLGNMQTAMIIGAGMQLVLSGRDLDAGRQRAVRSGAGGLYLDPHCG
ncbi:Phosphotransferase system, mannose/fructose/N -acetylgalactosamine-specific component IIC [Citrobacter koseri]|uniref:Phosphotransferase system, mannose/fructose/N -acetylgalactosamine-specific component IIC n=1 Tax=Citrobacter koseri TaxID=545 RepID=A0A2X2WBA1_CITKO|nr:Phosphotransferase system, mannose/fructose/N -acetylgalactosamine-specific component IIC [Citrobacter koseri]